MTIIDYTNPFTDNSVALVDYDSKLDELGTDIETALTYLDSGLHDIVDSITQKDFNLIDNYMHSAKNNIESAVSELQGILATWDDRNIEHIAKALHEFRLMCVLKT
ncbi:hypothetical protein UFOVP109_25 [uncultured Caudovirales phage]|uniref:Uncharacterized protein n=1 Tax=uncultured Caudovirales phage TaxID=2100421 RepID=A0A6J7WLC9_9CAUD|nr:hypothetical protein UFOVP109_25 [uncultured Caudovirales phage]CAB5218869.1 hypothetical protein UFOVP224_5 [uncultured Caudovirales phage]